MRQCRECEKRVVGRSDKVFCCDECRNASYNRLHLPLHREMREMHKLLRENRGVLKHFVESGSLFVDKHSLTARGYRMNYMTHIELMANNQVCLWCYDYGILKEEAGWRLVSRLVYS